MAQRWLATLLALAMALAAPGAGVVNLYAGNLARPAASAEPAAPSVVPALGASSVIAAPLPATVLPSDLAAPISAEPAAALPAAEANPEAVVGRLAADPALTHIVAGGLEQAAPSLDHIFVNSRDAAASSQISLSLITGFEDGLNPESNGGSHPNPDSDPAYYSQTPDWATRLAPDPSAFATKAQRQAYEAELARLRPAARWMAHYYVQLREGGVQRPPNILTMQDLLNWGLYARKFDAIPGWNLKAAIEMGAESMFVNSLPSDPYEGRALQSEAKTLLGSRDEDGTAQGALEVLDKLEVPEHLPQAAAADPAAELPAKAQFVNEEPSLFQTEEVGAMAGPDYIVTPTVQARLQDLVTLFSTDYRKKFWPLLIGDTGEGKSSLIKFMFSLPEIKEKLGGRTPPVISLPVKEQMTRRELLGGKGPRGIELGLLSMAAQNGWVLVLEEANQASGEFNKALNDVLHQIRSQGFFEFEVGGQTVRIKAHPHFWLVATENPEEGNYANSRTPHSPDYMKRFVVRYYNRFPPAEQGDIMHGLAVRWFGEDFAARHGLTNDFFVDVVTRFHEPMRRMAAAGNLGGDAMEPYEFNRRTLFRFLRRYLADLHLYEKAGRTIDAKTRKLLLGRELMEAYGAEIRSPGEQQAVWDAINSTFELQSQYNIRRGDIELKVQGFSRHGDKLIVDDPLVPIELPVREKGGDRVPGREKRLTAVPSLMNSVYRELRNRQFGENQLSTGPTGTAKTSVIYFINHMLGQPLFSMTLDEQTPMSEFHGGFAKDPATGDFGFFPGILARAFMYDPEGVLKGGAPGRRPLTAGDIRRDPRIGATVLVNEANASPLLESINPALDDGLLNLSDGQHTAVAGGATHVVLTMNPVGEGYLGYPLTGALRSRFQTVEHPGATPEEELTEILLDQLTGVTRHRIEPAR